MSTRGVRRMDQHLEEINPIRDIPHLVLMLLSWMTGGQPNRPQLQVATFRCNSFLLALLPSEAARQTCDRQYNYPSADYLCHGDMNTKILSSVKEAVEGVYADSLLAQ